MSTNSPGAGRTDETGLGWPLRPRISRLLGWPFPSRPAAAETGAVEPSVSRETEAAIDSDDAGHAGGEGPVDGFDGNGSGADDAGSPPGRAAEPAEQPTPQPSPVDADAADPTNSGTLATDPAGASAATTDATDAGSALIVPPGSGRDDAVPEVKPRRAKLDDAGSPASPAPIDADEGTTGPVSRGTLSRVEPMLAPARTRTIVVANQKGGVGKTTTSVNLAAGLALGGLSVLVVDLDPQGNASTALGVEHGQGVRGTYEVLIDGDEIADLTVDSPEAPNLRVLPATVDLAGAEIELVSVVARENKLKRALRSYLAEHPTDYVLLDCPPSLGLLTLNALVAADEVLIPIQCEYYALEGVSQLMTTIELVMAELNEDLRLSTVLLTMFDGRTRLASQVAEEVRSYFSQQTLPTVIPRSVRISEAPSYGQTVITYHPDSAGALSYLEAAREIARRGAKENV